MMRKYDLVAVDDDNKTSNDNSMIQGIRVSGFDSISHWRDCFGRESSQFLFEW